MTLICRERRVQAGLEPNEVSPDKTLATVEAGKDPDAYMMQSDEPIASDLALQSIVEMWPGLDNVTRQRILRIANGK